MPQRAVAIGGSAGAVPVLGSILASLPADLAMPVFAVIHVGLLGSDRLAETLAPATALTVLIAEEGVHPLAGHVYLPPADRHLLVVGGRIRLGRGPREMLSRPALDPLFRSVAQDYGAGAIGLVLSGHLQDGAAGLAAIGACGGVTVVQDPLDAAAADMPMAALRASAVGHRATAASLGPLIAALAAGPPGPAAPPPPGLALDVEIALAPPTARRTRPRIPAPRPTP